MNEEKLAQLIDIISKGDTTFAESLFKKPGGRKYLENIVLILVNTLSYTTDEKEEIYFAFIKVLNRLEKRIKRQHEGQQILEQVSY